MNEDKGYNYPEDDENRYGWIVGHIDSHYESDDPEYGIVQSERQEAMAKLFAMAPDLIAELKRCYEREDVATEALLENAEMMREYVGQIIDLKRKIGMLQE